MRVPFRGIESRGVEIRNRHPLPQRPAGPRVKAGGNETSEIVTVTDTEMHGFGDVADAFCNWEDVWNERNC